MDVLYHSIRRASMNKRSFLFFTLLSLSLSVYGADVVIPNELENVEGDINNAFPFNITPIFGANSMRYQQLYEASDFGLLTGPELVTQIAFRPDGEFGGNFASTLTDIQVNLSTTSASAALSNVFANNVGPDESVVYSGALSLSSNSIGPIGGPKEFDIVITLQTPFLYDPTAGNLLLDVRNFDGGATVQFDAVLFSATPDAVSRAYTIVADGVFDPSGNADTAGLVTKFITTPASIEIYVDIKFCSDPNAFNCKKKGVLPVTIFGTADFDVATIDPSTLKLCLADLTTCTNAPRDWSMADRGDPATDIGAEQCAIIDLVEQDFLTQDGIMDFDAAFEAVEVQALLGDFCGQPQKSTSQTLFVVGETFDGVPIVSLAIDDVAVDQLWKANK
jgi:hypothetical protein